MAPRSLPPRSSAERTRGRTSTHLRNAPPILRRQTIPSRAPFIIWKERDLHPPHTGLSGNERLVSLVVTDIRHLHGALLMPRLIWCPGPVPAGRVGDPLHATRPTLMQSPRRTTRGRLSLPLARESLLNGAARSRLLHKHRGNIRAGLSGASRTPTAGGREPSPKAQPPPSPYTPAEIRSIRDLSSAPPPPDHTKFEKPSDSPPVCERLHKLGRPLSDDSGVWRLALAGSGGRCVHHLRSDRPTNTLLRVLVGGAAPEGNSGSCAGGPLPVPERRATRSPSP